MAGASAVEVFVAPHLGVDTESAPVYVGKGYAQTATNVLTGRPGRLPVRGGLTAPSASLWADADAALWAARGGRLVLARPGNTSIAKFDSAGVLTTTVVPTVDDVPGPFYAQVGNNIYGIGVTGRLLALDGGTGTLVRYGTPLTPLSGFDITYWKNRLWYLGGSPAGGVATVYTDRVYWSDLTDFSAALPLSSDAWKDDVSGLTNQIVLGTVSGSNAPVGFGRLPSGLIIFGTQGGDLLLGSSPSDLNQRAAEISHGCVDRRAILEYGSSVIWLAREGLFMYDGVEEVELSARIRSSLAADLADLAAAGTFAASTARLPNDYVIVNARNAAGDGFARLLHVPTRSWSDLTFPSMTPRLVSQAAVDTKAVAYDGSRVWTLDSIAQPVLAATPAGVDTTALGTAPFTARTTSRLARLSTPLSRSQLRQLYIDTIATDGGWTATVTDADAAVIVGPVALAASATATRRHRTALEAFGEVQEVALTMEYSGASADAAELEDAFIEYDATRKSGGY